MFYKVASETIYEKMGRRVRGRGREEDRERVVFLVYQCFKINPFSVKLGKSVFYKIDFETWSNSAEQKYC